MNPSFYLSLAVQAANFAQSATTPEIADAWSRAAGHYLYVARLFRSAAELAPFVLRHANDNSLGLPA